MAIYRMQNEKAVKEKCKRILKKYGAWCTFPHQRGYSLAGVPDILACVRGSFIAIECKSGSNKVTARQQTQLDQIQQAGGMTFVINESNIELLEGFLETLCGERE